MNVLYRFPSNEPQSTTTSEEVGPGRRRRGRLLLILVLTGCALGLAFTAIPGASKADTPSATASGIKALVIKTALHRPSDATQPHGGVLGPWWIYAAGSEDGELLGLCLEGSDAHIAASKARVLIDTDTNSLSLHLQDAVIVSLPGKNDGGHIERHESIRFGPVPMSIDIQSEHNDSAFPYS